MKLFLAIYLACLLYVGVGAQRLRGSDATARVLMQAIVNPSNNTSDRRLVYNERKVFQPTSKPWTAVGKVETDTTTYGGCTGVLVGPCLMLTSQCCVHNTIGNLAHPLRFTPAYYDGNAPFGTAEAIYYWWDLRLAQPKAVTDLEYAFNYVVVKLDKCLGYSAGYWCFKSFDRSWEGKDYWRTIGYAHDLANNERPFYIETDHSVTGTQAFTNADGASSFGMGTDIPGRLLSKSGDPIYGMFDGEPCVIGVGTSLYLDENGDVRKQFSGGLGLEALIEYDN